MVIAVAQGSVFKPVARIYQKQGAVWKECLLVQYWTSPGAGQPIAPVVVFDRYMVPPTGVRGVSASYSSGVLAWNAGPQAQGYQVLRRPAGRPGDAPTILPAPDTWTSELSLNAVGLAQNTSYDFTVRAHRITVEGLELISPESSAIRLYTGYPPVTNSSPGYPGSILTYVYPSRSDSWTSDYGWGGSSGGPDVIQGRPTNTAGTNHKGAVAYNTAWSQINAAVAPYGQDRFSIEVTDARIERIHRRGAGGGTPALWFWAARIDFGIDPQAQSGAVNIGAAPATNSDRTDINFGGLVDWVRYWIQFQLYATHNGIMVFRNDGSGNATNGYDGYVVLQNATGDVWRLKVWIRWSTTTPGSNPYWTTL